MPKAHPPALRKAATAFAAEHGIGAAARKFGVSGGTVSKWCKADGVESLSTGKRAEAAEAAHVAWDERKTTMAHRMGGVAELALDKARAELEDGTPSRAKDCATTMAILVDKAQLLTGGQTARHGLEKRGEVLHDARDAGLRLVG